MMRCVALSVSTRVLMLSLAMVGPLAAQQGQAVEISLEEFVARAVATHPLVQQATAAREQVQAEALTARGGFDPYVTAIWDTKRFKGIGYYDEFDARLVLPTPWGVDFKLGWERAAGQIINPERATPGDGLLSFGIALPIGPRLLTDERRTALRQAEIVRDAADADRDAAIARVVQGAARDWGAWAEAEQRARIAEQGVELARFRFAALRQRVATGDAAAVDSLEALAELTTRELSLLDARAAARVARLMAESWWWTANGEPEPLPAAARPAERALLPALMDVSRVDARQLRYLVARHPAVQGATARWRTADAARRLASVSILPSASVEISGLSIGSSLSDLNGPSLGGEDSKFSGGVRLPILARREVGRLRAAEARTRALATERERVRRDVSVEVERALVELEVVDAQLGRQEALVALQGQLLTAEQQRFEAGESSLLTVNLRERLVLDERLRLASLVARRARALGTLTVALGTPRAVNLETPARPER